MDDAAGLSRLKRVGDPARHTVTVRQVAQLLDEAGVPRSDRRIKYYCQNETLDAGYLPSPTGDQWYINPASVPGLIGDLKQFDEQERRREQHAAATSIPLKEAHRTDTVAAGSSLLEPASTEKENAGLKDPAGGVPQQAAAAPAAAYLAQLEKHIEEKDETIKFLQEELVDRRSQISGMKAIIDGQRQLLETINNNVAPVFWCARATRPWQIGD